MKINRIINIFIVIFIFCIVENNAFSQQSKKIDSLENLLKFNQHDSNYNSIRIKLIMLYFQSDTSKANKYLYSLSKEIDENRITSPLILYQTAQIYESYKNEKFIAIKYYEFATQEAKKLNSDNYIDYAGWLGYTYSTIGEYEKAFENLLNAVSKAENDKQLKKLPISYLLLAYAFRNSQNHSKAKEYFEKCIQISNQIGDNRHIHNALHEIGNLFLLDKNYKEAISYQMKALRIREKNGDVYALMFSYYDIAQAYQYIDSIHYALTYFNKAEKIAVEINNKWQLAHIYSGIILCYLKNNEPEKSKSYIDKMGALADEFKAKTLYSYYYESLYLYYKFKQQYDKALMAFEIRNQYNDSVSNEEVTKNINELDKKYESAKKDKEIIKNQEYIKRQKIIILFVVLGFVIVLIFSLIAFRLYRQKKQAFTNLELKNQEILQQKEEIRAQAEYLESANIEITNQKSQIEKSHKQITASINYAKRIQEAVLPRNDILTQIFSEHFILFLPRDIVSGDFYFIKELNNEIFIAVADCTGHGVPGAFMSMLGVAILNELVRNPELKIASEYLEELRIQLKQSLQQTGREGEQKDGIDIAFVKINKESNILNYSGANNSVLIIRNHVITEIKANRMPVGIYKNEKPFTNHEFKLEKNDVIYLFSDGYYSQFCYSTKETMKASRFKEYLSQINAFNLEVQKQKLISYFNEWKGSEKQIDDVLIIGIKI